MAKHTTVKLIDDVDGSEAHETVFFGLDGKQYDIDLSAANAARLRKALEEFASAARRSGARAVLPVRTSVRTVAQRENAVAIREWATGQGMSVSARGRISAEIVQAYHLRDQAVTEPEPSPEPKSNVHELVFKPSAPAPLDLDKVMAWWRSNNPKSNAGRPTERIQRLYLAAHTPDAQAQA